MKKSVFVLFFVSILFSSGFAQKAQKGVIDLGAETSSIEMTANNYQKLALNFTHEKITSFTVETKEGIFDKIVIPGARFIGEIGSPKLPAYNKLIEIPFGAEVSIKVINYSVNEYKLSDYGINNRIIPTQPDVSKSENPADVKFHYSANSYSKGENIEFDLASVDVMGTMRGARIAKLTIAPVSYSPNSGTIKVYNNIQVEVEFSGSDISNTKYIKRSTYSPFFQPVYNKLLNSKNVIDDHPDLTKYPVKMLILADRMFEDALQPYIAWKTKKGFNVIVNYTDEGYSNVQSIKDWVQMHYEAGTPEDPAPSFCLFVGDVAQIPASQVGVNSGRQTDLYYFSQDGDYFPEMYYGRFSANNLEQLQPQIDKTLYHERYEFEDPTYLDDVTLIAGEDGSWNPKVGQPTVQYGTENYFNAEHNFVNVNDYLNSYSGCYDNERISVSFINYTAHCNETMWGGPSLSISDVNAFTNTNKYPLAVGNCCMSADFGYGECIGEAWMRAENKGAVAYIGSSPSSYWFEDFYWAVGAFPIVGDNNGYVPTFEETTLGVYDAMFVSDYVTVDATVFLGNLVVTEVEAEGYPAHSNPLYYWEAYNCLGDPSLVPYRTQGEINEVSHMPTIPIGVTIYEVTAEPGSYVAISKDGILHGVALVDESGVAEVQIEPVTSGGDVDIVVTKPQYQPYMVVVQAASLDEAYLTVSGYTNTIDFGQTENIDLTIENVGSEDATDVSVTVSTIDENANFTNETYYFGTIAAGASAVSTEVFTLTVSNEIEDQYQVSIDIEITGNGKTLWEQTKSVTVNAPVLEVALDGINDNSDGVTFMSNPVITVDTDENYSYDISVEGNTGNGNGLLDAGETVGITVNATNNGHASSYPVTCTLTTTSPEYVTVNSGEINLGVIAVDQILPALFSISVDESTPVGTVVEIIVTLVSGQHSEEIVYNLAVGLQIEDFETGDFTAYPWEMSGDADWTIEDSEVHEGAYSAKSGSIDHDQTSEMSVSINVVADSEITFWNKVSSEGSYDYLKFYIDNNLIEDWSGELEWDEQTYTITAGVHTLKWTYEKDGSVSNEPDCAWIDYIIFPGHTTAKGTRSISITGLTLPTWLTLTDNGDGTGNLSGTAPANAELFDVVLQAQDGGASVNQEFTISVRDYNSVGNLEKSIKIFPNPNKGTFLINSNGVNEELNIEIYSISGQLIYKNISSNNVISVDMNDEAKGVYLIKITSGKEVYNSKIILK